MRQILFVLNVWYFFKVFLIDFFFVYIDVNSIADSPDSVWSARVTPSRLNALKPTHGLLFACHAASRHVNEINGWFRIHREIKEELDYFGVSENLRLCRTLSELLDSHEGEPDQLEGWAQNRPLLSAADSEPLSDAFCLGPSE